MISTNRQQIGVSFSDVDGKDDPVYSFDPSLNKTFVKDNSLLSRWQIQVGLRYIF